MEGSAQIRQPRSIAHAKSPLPVQILSTDLRYNSKQLNLQHQSSYTDANLLRITSSQASVHTQNADKTKQGLVCLRAFRSRITTMTEKRVSSWAPITTHQQ